MIALFHQGGWVMWALLALSLVAWSLIVWKWFELADERIGPGWSEEVVERLRCGRPEEAAELCRSNRTAVADAMLGGILAREPDRAFFQKRLAPLLDAHALRLNRHLSLIGQLAVAAPLLGLLGTVLGMIDTFEAITAGGMGEVGPIADGVAKALITTEAGLAVALPTLLLHGWLSGRASRIVDLAALYAKKVEVVLCHD